MFDTIFNRITAEVKFTHTYTCGCCKLEEPGRLERVIFNVNSPLELVKALENQVRSVSSAPAGWGYQLGYKCPECFKTERT